MHFPIKYADRKVRFPIKYVSKKVRFPILQDLGIYRLPLSENSNEKALLFRFNEYLKKSTYVTLGIRSLKHIFTSYAITRIAMALFN